MPSLTVLVTGAGTGVVMVVPGAIVSGTAHFTEATRPADTGTAAAYTELEGIEQHIMDRLGELSPPGSSPRSTAEAVVRLVGLPVGSRPFRTPVDVLHDGAEQLDELARKLQSALMTRLGIERLLQPTGRRDGDPAR
ncbi:hypothetical protein ACIPW5_06670 [Streptomyces sp. NPDC090077]|uniref:hypothetical protein n=1 Tax=Streptomyces sp. NPDC090077 TaxID=3365938 RepID=UPI0037F6388D